MIPGKHPVSPAGPRPRDDAQAACPAASFRACQFHGRSSSKPVGRVRGDAGQDVGQPGLGIDIVHFGGDDQAVHGGGPLPAPIRAGEEP